MSFTEKRIPVDTAKPSPEMIETLSKFDLKDGDIEGWLAVPAIDEPLKRMSKKEIEGKGQVDAYKLLEKFLDNPTLENTLRTMDILNGCGHQCDTCLADAALPSKRFTYESLERLFSDERFIKMLQLDSLRLGSSGDIMDHPQAIEIIELILDKTTSIDRKQQLLGKRYKIKIFTNFRLSHKDELDKLFVLLQKYPNRLRVTLSLPFNKTDVVNKQFAKFASDPKRSFIFSGLINDKGFFEYDRRHGNRLQNFGIQDVRQGSLWIVGRVLSEEGYSDKISKYDLLSVDRSLVYENRGFVKTFFNPDELWLRAYVTPYESHTIGMFTPLSKKNIEALSSLPYHPDFPTPPNWPGGKGNPKHYRVAMKIKEEMNESGKKRKLKVVK